VPTATTENRNGTGLATLVGGILRDAQELTRQQIELTRVEVQGNTEKAKGIVTLFASGLAVAVVAGVLLATAAAGLLASAVAGLPAWGAQAIVGLVLALAAGVLFGVCRQQLASFSIFPDKAVEAMKENLEWKTRPN